MITKKKAKKPRKGESGSVKMNPDVLFEAKKYCIENGLLLYAYISSAVQNQLNNDSENGN